ncbi:MAG: dihydroxyacetone kinase phosphoryl donor subunit DhaM [Bacillota bacterium]
MVGIVIVAHSQKLAEGVKELADQVTQGKVCIVAAGGLDENTLGTSAERILDGIRRAYSPDGVVVLMDLGSAVLSAEMAVEMLSPEERERVLLCPAPLVEGAIAAAVQAALGSSLHQIDTAARSVVTLPKIPDAAGHSSQPAPAPRPRGAEVVVTVSNPLGLHARPAARFVQAAARFRSDISVRNLTKNSAAVDAKGIVQVLSLAVEKGEEIAISAEGPDQDEALSTLKRIIESGGEFEPRHTGAGTPGYSPQSSSLGAEAPGLEIRGIGVSPGIAIGPACVLAGALEVKPRQIEPGEVPREQDRLRGAITRAKEELRAVRDRAASEVGQEYAAIFDAHQLIIEDPDLVGRATELIRQRLWGAEWAVSQACEEVCRRLAAVPDEYIRARVADIRDVTQCVISALLGEQKSCVPTVISPVVVVGHDVRPSDVVRMGREYVLGLVTEVGSQTSHVAILARAMEVPAVVGARGIVARVRHGDTVMVDGRGGTVLVRPTPQVLSEWEARRLGRGSC